MTSEELQAIAAAATILERHGYKEEAVRLGIIMLSERK